MALFGTECADWTRHMMLQPAPAVELVGRTPRTFGYARVSTDDQNLALQLDVLRSAGCNEMFENRISGETKPPGAGPTGPRRTALGGADRGTADTRRRVPLHHRGHGHPHRHWSGHVPARGRVRGPQLLKARPNLVSNSSCHCGIKPGGAAKTAEYSRRRRS